MTRKKEIIYRIVKYEPFYKINSYTSMGWYIVDIQRYYEGSFISLKEYKDIISIKFKEIEEKDKKNIRRRLKRYILNNVKHKAKKIIIYLDRHPY